MHLSTRHLAIAATLSSASSAIAASDALSPLTSALSGSPIGSLQTGLSQFSNLVSPSIFAKLQSRMQTLPTRSSTPLTVPVQKAFAATSLAADNADKAALADAQSCLSDILARGSIPEGYACVDPNGNTVSAYTTACDTVLEQFVGIVPPSTMTVLQKQFNSYFASLGLIPPVNDLNTHLQNVIASVTASNSGEAVTGTERLQACLESALNGSTGLQQNYQCFMGKDSTWTSLNTLFAGIVQQFGGYLPPNVMQDVINIYMYYLSAANVPGLDMMKPMNNAMMSMTAAVAGNSVTAIEQMQQCFNDLLMTPDADARANYVCLMGSTGPIMTIEVLINGIIQQSFGYLPPTLVLQLEHDLRPYLNTSDPSSSAVAHAMQATFAASGAGPEFVTCFEALEDCVNEAVLSGSSATCTLQDKCKALVARP
ncbi:hypothetical protein JCM1841_001500 [Sporobolomyces salmonicolor]